MKNRINLLLPKEQVLADRIIYFAQNYLKYILVITQIFVIGVFFYRFKVDQQIIDLKDGLMQKQEIVDVSQPLIDEAKDIDYKIKVAQEVIKKQEDLKAMMDYLLSRFPEGVTLSDLKIGLDEISFKGISNNSIVLQAFYNKLQKEGRFKTIILKNIKKTDVGYTFLFSLASFQGKSL